MATALIGLGSNLGDRAANLNSALDRLRNTRGIEKVVASSFHASKPIGGPGGQPEFLNAAALVETGTSPHALLTTLQAIEHELGRVRGERWGPRTIDLDLLLYRDDEGANIVLETPELTVPHPRFAFRRFALEPALEVAAEMYHPGMDRTVAELVDHWMSAARYVAIIGRESRQYAQQVSEYFGASFMHSQFSLRPGYVENGWDEQALETEMQHLQKASWYDDGQLIVSDFWLDNWFANMLLGASSEAEKAAWKLRGERLKTNVVSPRLVVLAGEEINETSIIDFWRVFLGRKRPVMFSLDTTNTSLARADLLSVIESSL